MSSISLSHVALHVYVIFQLPPPLPISIHFSTSTLSISTLSISTLSTSTLSTSTISISTLSTSTFTLSTSFCPIPLFLLPLFLTSTLPSSTCSASTCCLSTLPTSTIWTSFFVISLFPLPLFYFHLFDFNLIDFHFFRIECPNQVAAKDMRKFKQILLDIETMYVWLLELEDAEKRVEALAEDSAPGPHHQAAADYQQRLLHCLSAGDRLVQVLFVRKGKVHTVVTFPLLLVTTSTLSTSTCYHFHSFHFHLLPLPLDLCPQGKGKRPTRPRPLRSWQSLFFLQFAFDQLPRGRSGKRV